MTDDDREALLRLLAATMEPYGTFGRIRLAAILADAVIADGWRKVVNG